MLQSMWIAMFSGECGGLVGPSAFALLREAGAGRFPEMLYSVSLLWP